MNPRRYQPPFTVTAGIVSQVAAIAESLGRLGAVQGKALRLRRINRIRSSLAIEGNTLSEAQIAAILDDKPVIAPPREVLEARNALAAAAIAESLREAMSAETPVETLVKMPDALLAVLHAQPTLTLAEVAKVLGKSTSAVERAARKLREQGRLHFVGRQKRRPLGGRPMTASRRSERRTRNRVAVLFMGTRLV